MPNREKVITALEKLCKKSNCPFACFDALTLLKEQEWIPIEERLPEEPFGCLVTIWDSKPNGGDDFPNILPYFVGWDGEQWNDNDGERCPFEVIAWMKLPEPYQPKD